MLIQYIFHIHLDVINVKCLATTKISVSDKRYASTAVCLNLANLVSVKDLPSVSTALVKHPANSKGCPQWEKEMKMLKIRCENKLSFPEARKQYEQFYEARTYAGAV